MTINTTLNVTLSSTLLSTHTGGNPDGLLGVSASAFGVYFDTTGAHWQKYVLDGVQQGAQPAFNWTSAVKGEKVYVIIESGSVDYSTGSVITQESDINWSNAKANNFRFDSFELTLSGNAADQGNLTSVNYFGLPMEVSTSAAANGTRGYNVTGESIFTSVVGQSPAGTQDFDYTAGGLSGQRMVAGPTQSVSDSTITSKPFVAANWNSYVTALQDNAQASKVAISGWFNGAADASNVWHNAGFYSYDLSWDGANFWLNPEANSQVLGHIKISPSALTNSIYSTLGTVDIYTNQSDHSPFLPGMNTGANNEWGAVLRDFLTGFTGGYYGGSGNASSLNPLLSGTLDLNKTWNWDPTFAFGNDGSNALTGGFSGFNNKYDPYAKLFFENTNSYGAGYSDNLMKAYATGGPLLSLWDNSANQNVPTINLTVFGDHETPAGYTERTIYNYLAPDAGGYVAATQFVGDGLNIVLSFINAQTMLKDGTPIRIAFYSGGTGGNFDSYVDIPTSGTIFQNWNIVPDSSAPGGYVAQAYNPAVPTPGSILLNQLPAAANGGKVWYQITVGQGTDAHKTFDLYSTTTGTANAAKFVNPAETPTAVQVDGLANVTATPGAATVGTYTVNFLGTTYAVDPSLLMRVTDPSIINNAQNASFPTATAPVIGSLASGTFVQLAAPGAQDPTIASAELAFGWKGADTSAGNDVSTYSNKVAALDWVDVKVVGEPLIHVTAAQADIDGKWTTVAAPLFANGTHKVVFHEYDGDPSSASSHIVAKTSAQQEFVVQLSQLPFGASADGDGLMLSPNGSATTGNWIKLEATGSSLLNGTLLVYTTDSQGHLIGRDGKVGVSLDDAVLARFGSVAADDGTSLFGGKQAVYLGVGKEMHFAILTGNGELQERPDLKIDGTGAPSVSVHGTNGSLQFTASVDNTLSNDAMLGGSQRQYDKPWVYLENNASVSLEIAGSAANVNTVHFVKFDVNSATGAWSVGGVAYGNTDAFRAAVQTNWDAGIAVQNGNGTFHTATDWHVSGGTGFYAPVLKTEGGDVFVIGTANVDGHEHVRTFGQNTFGFEDLRANQGSDFDYNDMVMKIHWDGL
jgi:hypothetical protein